MLHQHTANLVDLFVHQPLVATSSTDNTIMSTSSSHLAQPRPLPHLPGKPLTGLSYLRRRAHVPEVLPLVAVVGLAVGIGRYLGSSTTRTSTAQPSTSQPWLHTATDSTRWDGVGGVREMLVAAGKADFAAAEDQIKHAVH